MNQSRDLAVCGVARGQQPSRRQLRKWCLHRLPGGRRDHQPRQIRARHRRQYPRLPGAVLHRHIHRPRQRQHLPEPHLHPPGPCARRGELHRRVRGRPDSRIALERQRPRTPVLAIGRIEDDHRPGHHRHRHNPAPVPAHEVHRPVSIKHGFVPAFSGVPREADWALFVTRILAFSSSPQRWMQHRIMGFDMQ